LGKAYTYLSLFGMSQLPPNLQALLQQLQAQAQPKKPLVEFKAGMLTQSGTTITADERRGKLSLIQGDNQLLHLVWKLRPQDTTELDLTIVPQGATFEKIPECTTGRVLFLKFKNSNTRRFFFWLQEPKDDQDDKLVKQLNDFIENPPRAGADGMGGMGEMGGMGDDEMEQAALLSMFGGGAGASDRVSSVVRRPPTAANPPRIARPATTTSVAPPTNPLVSAVGGPASTPIMPSSPTPSTPATIATTITTAAPATPARPATTTTTTTTTVAPAPAAARPSTATTTTTTTPSLAATLTAMAEQLAAQQHSLENILEAERVLPQLEEKDIASLLEHLPEGQRTPHDLEQTLRSPQLQQTLQNVSQILNSRQFGALMASLGLPTTGSMGVLPFCEAIQKQADEDKKKEGGDKK